MPVREKPGRSWTIDADNTEETRIYGAYGYATEDAALSAVLAAIPATVTLGGLALEGRRLDVEERDRAKAGLYDFDFEVTWFVAETGDEPPTTPDGRNLSFNLTGGPTYFSNARSQTAYGTDAPDFGTSIGVNEDKTISGIDVAIPPSGLQVSDRVIFLDEVQFNEWIESISAKIWTKNSVAFRTLQPGDAFLRSVTGNWVVDYTFDIALDIAIQRGEDNPTVEGIAITQRVAGFDTVWVYYEKEVDTAAKLIKPKARGVYVAEVFKSSDFSF